MFNMVLRGAPPPPDPPGRPRPHPEPPLVMLGARSTQRFLGLFPFDSCAVITSAGFHSLSRFMIDRGTGRTGHDLFLGHAYELLKQSPNLAVRCPSTAMGAGITTPDRNGFLARFRTPAGGHGASAATPSISQVKVTDLDKCLHISPARWSRWARA